jgi:hypothetical protein
MEGEITPSIVLEFIARMIETRPKWLGNRRAYNPAIGKKWSYEEKKERWNRIMESKKYARTEFADKLKKITKEDRWAHYRVTVFSCFQCEMSSLEIKKIRGISGIIEDIDEQFGGYFYSELISTPSFPGRTKAYHQWRRSQRI